MHNSDTLYLATGGLNLSLIIIAHAAEELQAKISMLVFLILKDGKVKKFQNVVLMLQTACALARLGHLRRTKFVTNELQSTTAEHAMQSFVQWQSPRVLYYHAR